ncbi:MAG: zf-HC2 domain-containing protein, partial [Candidatus Aminicenantes bacterium]|nr:zf-HC2 domain-containing protein [Candidatus Aminicenantes bacterium]
MRCEAARKWISDDLDRSLSSRRMEALERHLQGCEACRAYRDDLALIQARTKAQPVPSLAPEDWSRFERNLEREV